MVHYVGKNPSLTLWHIYTHLSAHHTKGVNMKIASCVPQAQLLRCTVATIMLKYKCTVEKYGVGCCNPVLCPWEKQHLQLCLSHTL